MDIPSVDAIEELDKVVQLYQNGLLLDNEPFPIDREWIEALNIRGELSGTRKQRVLTLITDWGKLVLLLETPLPTNNAHHNNKIRSLASTGTRFRWRSSRPVSSARREWWLKRN